MEKRTFLAIGLSMVVMFGFLTIQNMLYPPKPPGQEQQDSARQSQETASPGEVTSVSPQTGSQGTASSIISSDVRPVETAKAAEAVAGEFIPQEDVIIETDLIRVILTNAGGDIVSFRLKKHLDGGEPVEMILTGNSAPRAFNVAFGNREDVLAGKVRPEGRNFRVRRVSNLIVEFSQVFDTVSGGQFTMVKRYEFKPNEYMFELTVTLDGGYSVGSFNFNGASYTLIFGPQIGPRFVKLDQRYEYRHYQTYKGKIKNEKVSDKEPTVISNQPVWAAIAGKYFALIALPLPNQYELTFSTQAESGLSNASRLLITRPASGSSRIEDKYRFYLGPKNQESLSIYDRGENGFDIRNMDLIEVAATKGFLAPLEIGLKWFLMLFHRLIPNYGIAIILLTLLVKIIMFPLTKKGSESTIRMQALSPKIKEIQEKNKGNPQKMNAEMGAFYKKEGYNPLSGCLPMLIQLPIFIAMYNLFNNHFDLRGAMFIPGWIPDLSLPEAIYNFPENVKLPILGWNALRLLPFLYVGSQLLYGKVVQTPDQKSNSQMKLMLYAMPIVFFFILYDVPSGLLLYWIMSNLLTMVQQVSINKFIVRKKAAAAAAAASAAPEPPKPVIAPPGAKKKKKK